MSLIYDALRQQSGSVATEPAAMPRASWWLRQSAPRRSGLLVAAGALLAAPLAFLAAGQFGAPASASSASSATTLAVGSVDAVGTAPMETSAIGQATPVAAAMVETALPTTVDAQPPAPAVVAQVPAAVLPVETPVPSQAIADTQVSLPASVPAAVPVQTPAPARIANVVQIQEEPQPINIKVERRGEGSRSVASTQDDQSVQAAIASIEAAIADGDAARTRQALAELESLLPSSSLTLLRMQAWVAHRDGDMASAEQLYRRIAERVPDDENAGVNIALLSAGRGDIDDARLRLTRLAGRHTRSALVTRALADIEAQAR